MGDPYTFIGTSGQPVYTRLAHLVQCSWLISNVRHRALDNGLSMVTYFTFRGILIGVFEVRIVQVVEGTRPILKLRESDPLPKVVIQS